MTYGDFLNRLEEFFFSLEKEAVSIGYSLTVIPIFTIETLFHSFADKCKHFMEEIRRLLLDTENSKLDKDLLKGQLDGFQDVLRSLKESLQSLQNESYPISISIKPKLYVVK
ncbi:hypothetical protein JK635_07610 [Neobacillus sp. YIM B02564]|uniref:LXG domain-containing protein n=1 Tax=Neobacillus paridis TaxID=2803862 RepID=A0ABS1TL94_9BACI|nr:hypothetical protein [Neobacillus paridis]MBL4952075.1 hypothetical protein [Neobacillus paridis]